MIRDTDIAPPAAAPTTQGEDGADRSAGLLMDDTNHVSPSLCTRGDWCGDNRHFPLSLVARVWLCYYNCDWALFTQSCDWALLTQNCDWALFTQNCDWALFLQTCNWALFTQNCNWALFTQNSNWAGLA